MPTLRPPRPRWCVAISIAWLMLADVACTTQTVTISRWLPAEVALDEVSSVAVAPFEGPLGDGVTAPIRREMDATEHFVISNDEEAAASWTTLGALDSDGEMALQDRLLALGRAMSSDAVLGGKVRAIDIQVAHHTVVDGHAQHATCHLTREVTARILGEVAVIRSDDGQALHFAPIDFTWRHRESHAHPMTVYTLGSCDDPDALALEVLPAANQLAWQKLAIDAWARAQAQAFVPHYEGQEVELYVDDGIPESKRAIASLLVGDWQSAVAIYSRGVEAAQSWITPRSTRAKAHYNLGTTLAYGGMVAQGLEHLERAQAIAPCPRFAEQIAQVMRYRAKPQQVSTRHHVIGVPRPQ